MAILLRARPQQCTGAGRCQSVKSPMSSDRRLVALRRSRGARYRRAMTPFHLILVNSLIQNVTNFTVWFALTFWVFLETRSVFVTGMIGGIYLVFTAGLRRSGSAASSTTTPRSW